MHAAGSEWLSGRNLSGDGCRDSRRPVLPLSAASCDSPLRQVVHQLFLQTTPADSPAVHGRAGVGSALDHNRARAPFRRSRGSYENRSLRTIPPAHQELAKRPLRGACGSGGDSPRIKTMITRRTAAESPIKIQPIWMRLETTS